MDSMHLNDLKELVEVQGSPCISIYMPTYRAGREVRQNAIRWKNLVDHIEKRLEGDDQWDKASVEARLKELEALTGDDDYWQHQADGLAAFVTADDFRRFRLPLDFDEFAAVGKRYHVSPLIPLFQADGQFFILAVSQNSVRLLRATKHRVTELEPDELPTDLRSALNIDEYMSSLQHHSGAGVSADENTIFHGHGGSDPDVKKQDEILQYFYRIDEALQQFFQDHHKTLVFAGVDYLFPIFQKASSHAGLVDEPVTGNPDDLTPEELHERAWTVVEPLFSAERQTALARFGDAAHTDRATNEIEAIVQAARQGQIDTLLIADGAEATYGTIDPSSGQVRRADESDSEAEDLVNSAVVETLLNSGTVYTVEREQLNGDAVAAAILRYPFPMEKSASTG